MAPGDDLYVRDAATSASSPAPEIPSRTSSPSVRRCHDKSLPCWINTGPGISGRFRSAIDEGRPRRDACGVVRLQQHPLGVAQVVKDRGIYGGDEALRLEAALTPTRYGEGLTLASATR